MHCSAEHAKCLKLKQKAQNIQRLEGLQVQRSHFLAIISKDAAVVFNLSMRGQTVPEL